MDLELEPEVQLNSSENLQVRVAGHSKLDALDLFESIVWRND